MPEPYMIPQPPCPECGGPPDTGAGHDCEKQPDPPHAMTTPAHRAAARELAQAYADTRATTTGRPRTPYANTAPPKPEPAP